ncbi:MAG: YHYH protein [Pseudomonadota bacterium]
MQERAYAMIFKRFASFALFGAFIAGCAAAVTGQPPTRNHTATVAQPLSIVPATRSAGVSYASVTTSATTRTVTANGIPDHLVGQFPNRGNPNRITEQSVSLELPLIPAQAGRTTSAQGWVFGVSLNGVVFDPFAGEFWQGDRRSGWNYDALGGAVSLGLDENYGHVQPGGTYHYHGMSFGLLELLRYDETAHSPLVGYAADGYPIYALTGIVDGQLTEMTSSYRLKSGTRPGGAQPGGAYDGAFVQDYEYVAGLGNLDACNGAFTQSAEYPGGTYAYFITEDWPVVPRCFTGTPSQDFRKGPPPRR